MSRKAVIITESASGALVVKHETLETIIVAKPYLMKIFCPVIVKDNKYENDFRSLEYPKKRRIR